MDKRRGARKEPVAEVTDVILLSDHAFQRVPQRNLSDAKIAYVLAHGTRIRRTGIIFVTLRRRDIPADDLRIAERAGLEGTTLLLGPDGVLITVYRNREVLRKIVRKAKHRRVVEEIISSCAADELVLPEEA